MDTHRELENAEINAGLPLEAAEKKRYMIPLAYSLNLSEYPFRL